MTTYIDFPDNPCPENGDFAELDVKDVKIRYAIWSAKATQKDEFTSFPAQSVLILTGRNEFIEKYFEVIQSFLDRGISVGIFDWRGQGLSSRTLKNPLKGHVNNFDEYISDLESVFVAIRERLPGPYGMLAHSMGAHIGLRALVEKKIKLSFLILSAPMLDIKLSLSRAKIRWLARAATRLKLGKIWVFGQGKREFSARQFEGNVLTSDPRRFKLVSRYIEVDPRFGLAGPTYAWLHSALESIEKLEKADLGVISIPVLMLCASEEVVVSNAKMREMIGRISRGEIVTIPNAQHELLCEKDIIIEDIWRIIDVFLQRVFC